MHVDAKFANLAAYRTKVDEHDVQQAEDLRSHFFVHDERLERFIVLLRAQAGHASMRGRTARVKIGSLGERGWREPSLQVDQLEAQFSRFDVGIGRSRARTQAPEQFENFRVRRPALKVVPVKRDSE